jgi:TnsA endonuclease N terminal/TnsA endonuclease C terminal
MPVREIPKSYCNVTGLVATDKSDTMTGYESRLEHDCQKLVGLNLNVSKYEEQPLKVYYTTHDGKRHSYTPDILINYRTDIFPVREWKPLIAEIKYRSNLFKHWSELKPKLLAARQYAKERSFDFTIITDREVYTPFLKNAIFLLEFRKYPINQDDSELLLDALKTSGEADPYTLIRLITIDQHRKAELLPTLWQLIANYKIRTNLEEPLTMRSRIWSALQPKDGSDEILLHPRAGLARHLRWRALRYYPYLES